MDLLAVAPVRTADAGGWSDTWFANAGVVCSVSILPGVTVQLTSAADLRPGQIALEARALGFAGLVDVAKESSSIDPLLEAAICATPLAFGARCIIDSGVPAGSGLGTSAAVVVALLAVLRAANGEEIEPREIAQAAHAIETGLGQQSGVQDQLSAAFGGVNRFQIAYPLMTQIDTLPFPQVTDLLKGRLLTVYLGAPHQSSKLHEQVIASLPGRDPETLLSPMVEAAESAFASITKGDLVGYGAALTANHEAIRNLHPQLISALADQVASTAQKMGALGWKVNGAGGEGGTLAILFASPGDATRFSEALADFEECTLLNTTLASTGVSVTRRLP